MHEGAPENPGKTPERRAVRVSLTFDDFRSFITQYEPHLSMGGMFIGTRSPLPPGTLCKLDVRLKAGDSLITGLGEVVWTRERAQGPERPPGMGMRFRELEDASRDLIFAIVDRRLEEGANVFQLEQGQEENVPDLSDLLKRAETHRREAEEQAAASEGAAEAPAEVDDVPPIEVAAGDADVEPMLAAAQEDLDLLRSLTEETDEEPPPAIEETRLPSQPASSAEAQSEVLPELPDFVFEDGSPEEEDDELAAAGGAEEEDPFDPPRAAREPRTSRHPSRREIEDLQLRRPDLMSELYPGIAERLEAAGDAPERSIRDTLYTDEVLQSLDEPLATPRPEPARPARAAARTPAPVAAERTVEGTSRDEVAERLREMDAALDATSSAQPPRSRWDFDALVEPAPPGPQLPEPALEDSGWHPYGAAYSRPSSRARRWLVPILVLVLLGGAFALWQMQDGEQQEPPAAAVVARPRPAPAAPPVSAESPPRSAEPPVTLVPPQEGPEVAATDAPAAAPGPAPPPPASLPPPPAAAAMSVVRDVVWQRVEQGTLVTITADGAVLPESFEQARIAAGAPRFLLRFLRVEHGFDRPEIPVGTPEVRRIRSGYHQTPRGQELHIVLDLSGPGVQAARVESQADRLLVWLSGGGR